MADEPPNSDTLGDNTGDTVCSENGSISLAGLEDDLQGIEMPGLFENLITAAGKTLGINDGQSDVSQSVSDEDAEQEEEEKHQSDGSQSKDAEEEEHKKEEDDDEAEKNNENDDVNTDENQEDKQESNALQQTDTDDQQATNQQHTGTGSDDDERSNNKSPNGDEENSDSLPNYLRQASDNAQASEDNSEASNSTEQQNNRQKPRKQAHFKLTQLTKNYISKTLLHEIQAKQDMNTLLAKNKPETFKSMKDDAEMLIGQYGPSIREPDETVQQRRHILRK
jgi:hypothetical protein